MDKTKQRIAIAEACLNHSLEVYRTSEGDINTAALPNYTGDLNAMHEAEKVLDMHQQYAYGETLARATIGAGQFDDPEGFTPNGWGYYAPSTATAAQRAEAFLRTIGKWEGWD